MKIYVQFKEGADVATHWRQLVTLPKKWLTSPCERLRTFLVEQYNKARPAAPQLAASEWHLCNEIEGVSMTLGVENNISDVMEAFDEIILRPGEGVVCTNWRRASAKSAVAASSVLVPVEFAALSALRAAVDADDTDALKRAVDDVNLASPHEVLVAETDVKDANGKSRGSEWHSMGGRFAWDSENEGQGEDGNAKQSLTAYARQRGATRILKLIEVADFCGAPIVGGGRQRDPEDIAASAATVAEKMGEMNAQLEASLRAQSGA